MATNIAAKTAQRDAIGVEVFANLFKAVVDEMAWVVLRSSHTTFVKETQDFGVALVTPEGEMFAYSYGSGATPLMGVQMDSVTAATNWQEGDVVITNDPYATRGMVTHLNDIYVFRPVFAEGRLLCLAWAFIHCTDVGAQAEAYRHLHQSGAGPYCTEAIAAALAAVEAALGQPAPVLQQAAQ